MNADGTGARSLTSALPVVVAPEARPAWSPDGTRIAFVGGSIAMDEDGYEYVAYTDIYVVRADGTDLRRVTNTDAESESAPAWRAPLPLIPPPNASPTKGAGK